MIIAVDTDVLVNWAMRGAPHHDACRRFVDLTLVEDRKIGLLPQIAFEFLHIVTDVRRFERPLEIREASNLVRELWDAPEVVRIDTGPLLLHRTLDLLDSFRLGRRRILDTALAATLEEAGVTRLATLNGSDFAVFPFLKIVEPN